jgi:hypothetical protein
MVLYFKYPNIKLHIIILRKLKFKYRVTDGQCISFSTQFSNVWTGQELSGQV